MPEPISAAIAFIGSTGIEILGFEIATSTLLATAALTAYSTNQQQRAQSKRLAAYRATLKDREVTLRSAIAPRRYVYGRDRLSGPLVYAETTGEKKQFLHLVIALAAHECDAIEQVWFGDELLPEPDEAGLIQSGSFCRKDLLFDREGAFIESAGSSYTLIRPAAKIVGIVASATGQMVTGWTHIEGSPTVSNIPATGSIVIEYAWTRENQPRVRIKKHLGQPGQVADADLVAESDGKWTAAHKGTGICYLYTRLEWDQDVFGSTGVPEIKCVLRGRKLADPRTSTVVWSDNAALAVADWLQRGEGLRASGAQVPSAEVIDAANVADEPVTLHDTGTVNVTTGSEQVIGNSPGWWPHLVKPGMYFYGPDGREYLIKTVIGVGAIPRLILSASYLGATASAQAYRIGHRRYTVNTSFTSDQSPREVLATLLQPMAGTAVWVQGRWLLRPGAYRTPAAPITANILAGSGVSIQPKASRADLFNAVRATYRDPAQGWAEVQAPMVTNAMYEAQDGGVRRVRDIQLDSAMDALRAQRLAKIELERGRQAMTVQLSTNLAGYNLAPTDVVPLQLARYGWPAGKDFEVIERTYTADGTIGYLLRETASGVWAWNYGEATTVDLAPDTSLPNPYARPPALTGLAVASGTTHLLRQVDGTLLTRAYVTWDASADAFVRQGGRIELRWRAAGTEQWQAEPPLPGDAASAYVAPVPDGTAVTFSVRQVNAVGSASDWVALMVTVLGKTEPPSNVTGLTSSVAAGVIRWAWDTCPDIDYQATEVRTTDAHWGLDSPAPLWRGQASELLERVATAGTYTRYVRHLDTGWRPSAATAVLTQMVGAGDLAGAGAGIGGGNLLPNSDCTVVHPWVVSYNPNGATVDPALFATPADTGWSTADYILSGGRTRNCYALQHGRNTGPVTDPDHDGSGNTIARDIWFGIDDDYSVPVVPGTRICASLFMQSHRCRAKAFGAVLNAAGAAIMYFAAEPSQVVGMVGSPAHANTLGAYGRSHAFFVVPPGGAKVRIAARKYDTLPGETNSFVWMAAPQIEVVGDGATGPSPYQPGPVALVTQLGYTGALDATRGAPLGTMVGSTPAADVESVAGAQAKANAAAAAAQTAAQAYAAAQAAAADVSARAYADGKVSAEEARAIADATAKADAARVAAEAAAAADATAKANAARVAAEAASATYAAAQAAAADVSARAYADGIVSDEEARAIADATAKSDAARVAAEAAAAADATAKANAAALTAQWSGVTGAGRPENNATVGATFGVNVKGVAPSVPPVEFAASGIDRSYTSIQQGFTVGADGLVRHVNGTNIRETPWHLGGAPTAAYWVELTVRTGPAPTSGASVGVPVSLSADVGWAWTQTGVGTTVIEGSYIILTGPGSGATVVGGGVFRGRLALISSA